MGQSGKTSSQWLRETYDAVGKSRQRHPGTLLVGSSGSPGTGSGRARPCANGVAHGPAHRGRDGRPAQSRHGLGALRELPARSQPAGSSTLLTLPGETFPEVDAVAIMASWQDIEKSEGVYDFSRLDFAYDYWKAHGKAIQLRVSAESLLWWTGAKPPSGTGIPPYVLGRLPGRKKQTRVDSGFPYVVVDAASRTISTGSRGSWPS